MHIPLPAWYRSSMCQVVLVGITCFCTTGMYSALSNLGAGGTQDITLSDEANGVLYGCFAIMGLFAGGITNCEYALSTLPCSERLCLFRWTDMAATLWI